MARRRAAEKRKTLPDPKFNDVVLGKFINNLMYDGKKSVAERIVYDALVEIQRKTKRDALEIFHEALGNVKPTIEVRSRRVGGATYQIPVEVRVDRAQALSIRWIIDMSRKRSEKTMMHRLSSELIDASNNTGASIKKREDTTKMAEANKAFSHYRW